MNGQKNIKFPCFFVLPPSASLQRAPDADCTNLRPSLFLYAISFDDN
jgi:hypothetical protein